ncbi:hypothetical protein JCM11641_003888 [Rhodosporidiobolus odoratus]
MPVPTEPTAIGVLALQGSFAEHLSSLQAIANKFTPPLTALAVRTPADLAQCRALILPGGESTTISLLIRKSGLYEPLREMVRVAKEGGNRALWGTCAGMILLAREIEGPISEGWEGLEGMDVRVARNQYGRQLQSFSTPLPLPFLSSALPPSSCTEPLLATFIRAPVLHSLLPQSSNSSPPVEPLVRLPQHLIPSQPRALKATGGVADRGPDADVVMARQGNLLVCSWHPELNKEDARDKYTYTMLDVETRLYIAGEYCEGKGETFLLRNPATEEEVAHIHSANKDDIDRAVSAAVAAQPGWARTDVKDRQNALRNFADLIDKHGDKLGELDAIAMGKPVGIDRMVRNYSSNSLRTCADLASSIMGDSSLLTPGQLSLTLRQPFGVTAGILPFNVPYMMLTNKLGPAVAAGNAIILKSSEKSPLSALYLAGLCKEAGFPPGIVQIVSGGGETGKLLAEHPDMRKISFTGSVATGKRVAAAAAMSNLKNVSPELGGKSPVLIFHDANVEKAAQACAVSIMINSGQLCANSRIYVHASIYDEFIEHIKKALSQFKHGDPTKEDTTLGPQADEIQGKRVAEYIEIGKTEGKVLMGGGRVGDKGYFFEPTLFVDVEESARVNKEEIFGPVGVVHKFENEADVLCRANDTEFASVFTRSIDRAIRFATEVESGNVTINAAAPHVDAFLPFGGYKQSGMGREFGVEGVKRWCEEKTVVIKLDE